MIEITDVIDRRAKTIDAVLTAILGAVNLWDKVPASARTGLTAAILAALLVRALLARRPSAVDLAGTVPRHRPLVRRAAVAGLALMTAYLTLLWPLRVVRELCSPLLTGVRPKTPVPGETMVLLGRHLGPACGGPPVNVWINDRALDMVTPVDDGVRLTVPPDTEIETIRVERRNPFPWGSPLAADLVVTAANLRRSDVAVRMESAAPDANGLKVRVSVFNRHASQEIVLTDVGLLILRSGPGAVGTYRAERIDLGKFEVTSDHLAQPRSLEPAPKLQDGVVKVPPRGSEAFSFSVTSPTKPHSVRFTFTVSVTYYTEDGVRSTVLSDICYTVASDNLHGLLLEETVATAAVL